MSIAVLMVGGGTAATFATSGYFGSSGGSTHHQYKHEFILKACAYLKIHHYYLWKLLCKPYLYGHGHWHGDRYGYGYKK